MTEQKKGEIIVVYGPQGCGKTRMADLIGLNYQADRVIDNELPLVGKHSASNWVALNSQADVGLRVVVLSNEDFDTDVISALAHTHPNLVTLIPFSAWLENFKALRTDRAADVLSEYWMCPASEIRDAIGKLDGLSYQIHEANKKVGWWDELEGMNDRYRRMLFAEKLALVHSEVTEVLEGVRKNALDDKLPWRWMAEVEIADIIIRAMDLAKGMGLDVGAPLIEKLAFNATREDHKRENRSAPGGKAF